jgi:hypothetical protein
MQFENLKGYAQKLKTELLRLRSQETMWSTKNKKLENEISELKKVQEAQAIESISTTQPLEISKPEINTFNPTETLNLEVTPKPIMEASKPEIIPAKPTETQNNSEVATKISEEIPKPEEASKPPVKLQRNRGPLETSTTTQIKRSREEEAPQAITTMDDQTKKQKTDT